VRVYNGDIVNMPAISILSKYQGVKGAVFCTTVCRDSRIRKAPTWVRLAKI
jgi:hypothetical protein